MLDVSSGQLPEALLDIRFSIVISTEVIEDLCDPRRFIAIAGMFWWMGGLSSPYLTMAISRTWHSPYQVSLMPTVPRCGMMATLNSSRETSWKHYSAKTDSGKRSLSAPGSGPISGKGCW